MAGQDKQRHGPVRRQSLACLQAPQAHTIGRTERNPSGNYDGSIDFR